MSQLRKIVYSRAIGAMLAADFWHPANKACAILESSLIRCGERGLSVKSVTTAFPQAKGHRSDPAKAEFASLMLPGFRFLLAAIVLCTSLLVLGLGAAALLRAAHEEVAQNPSWRGVPEPRFAQSEEQPRTVLAMLGTEPAANKPKTEPTIATDAPPSELRVAPAEAAVPAPPVADEEKAAPSAQESSPPVEAASPETENAKTKAAETETPKSDNATAETAQAEPPKPEVRPEPTAMPAAVAPSPATETQAAADTRIAAVEQPSPPANEASAAVAPAPPAPAAATVATRGRPAGTIEPDAQLEREAIAEQDQDEARQRLRAQRAKERRRLAARRARLAKQQPVARPATTPLFQPLPLPQQMQQTQLQQTQFTQTQITPQTATTRRTR